MVSAQNNRIDTIQGNNFTVSGSVVRPCIIIVYQRRFLRSPCVFHFTLLLKSKQ